MLLLRSYLPECTIGRLTTDLGEIICYTIERPWAENRPSVSCVPEGVYSVERYASPKFGDSLIIHSPSLGVGKYKGESDRYGILFHAANTASQLKGCIAPGKDVKPMNIFGHWEFGVTKSRDSMARLLDKYESELEIKTYSPFTWNRK